MKYIALMPRKARITIPGTVHHLMSRGIEGHAIFRDVNDRIFFLDLLGRTVAKTGYRMYAWVLMSNHYHLVVRTSEFPLGVFMRTINGLYAQYFRKSIGTRGYLFQDRYKSIVTQDQGYIEELIRYVHLNPMRAGICGDLEALDHYPWCGHSVIMGNRQSPSQNTTDILNRFDKNRSAAIAKYHSFIAQGIDASIELVETIRDANHVRESMHQSGCWVIGDNDFVRRVLAHDRERRILLAKHAREKIDLSVIAEQAAKRHGVAPCDILRRGRANNRSVARKAFAKIARTEYGIPIIAIARFLGISSPSVSEMLRDSQREQDSKT